MSNTTRIVVAVVLGQMAGMLAASYVAPHVPDNDAVKIATGIALSTVPVVIVYRMLGGAA